jgi:hypothetical protein
MRRMIVTAALLAGVLCLGLILSVDGHGRQLQMSPPAFLAALLQ